MFELNTEQFQGPLDKLLELIEARRLEVTAIALAEVTEEFIAYVNTLQRVGPDVLADFVVVASRLVLMKSKALLPNLELTGEEEREIADLEARLALYREFRAAGAGLTDMFKELPQSLTRELLKGAPPIFYPSSELTARMLYGAMRNACAALEMFLPKDEARVKRALVTVEEKIHELMDRFAAAASQSFKSLAEKKSRGEIVALFLAVLHLVRHHGVAVEQREQFGDMIITT